MTTSEVNDGHASASDRSGTGASRRKITPLIRALGHRELTLLVRYPVNTVSLFASMFVFFALIFFGGRAVAGGAITNSADGIVVGFFLWTLVTRAFQSLASSITREAQWGTLERLYMSPYGFGAVMSVKAVVDLCLSVAWAGAMLVPMMLVSGQWLHLDPLTVVPLVVLAITPVVGLGFLMGGLALLYKRVENLFGIVTFGFAGLIAAPVEQFEILKFLPLAQGSHLIRTTMTEGVRLWEFPVGDLAFLIGTAVGYIFVGFYCFRHAEHRARDRGLLGQY